MPDTPILPPGPWRAEKPRGYPNYYVYDRDGTHVCRVSERPEGEATDAVVARALTAVPELVEWSQRMLVCVDRYLLNGGTLTDDEAETVAGLRASLHAALALDDQHKSPAKGD